jgi:hypothetical protein
MSKNSQIHIRITLEEKEKILQNAKRLGFTQISEYLRFIGLLTPTYSLEVQTTEDKKSISGAMIKLECSYGK